ncbi:MAG: hypothetical protein IPJ71_04315 [Bdellovibrionales bacterium]|nr:hypothetical protein [Bdellovibrionales bacterium]
MKRLLIIVAVFACLATFAVNAQKDEHKHEKEAPHADHDEHKEDGHKHDEHEREDEHSGADEHGESHEHGKSNEHGEHEESAQVGPDKGILEVSESEGFKLSPEAEKNFELSRVKVSSDSLELPKSAIVTAVSEVNVFRYRNGFYKRIDFSEVNRSQGKIRIRSKDLKSGDEIVVHGLGFLRIAEIAAFGGAPEGHSH